MNVSASTCRSIGFRWKATLTRESALSECSPRVARARPTPNGSITHWIDAHSALAFIVLTLFYFVVTAALSSFKLLWLDELITVHIARLGSPWAILHALSQAADPNPPLTHLAVLACIRLFGAHTYAIRLPAIIGYWVGMLALFLFLKRHIPPTWAIIATLMSMGMGGFEWSYESRSYAIFYGTTMLALYFWSLAVDRLTSNTARSFALMGMTVSLALGLCANYFSVLAFFPIALGELTRTLQKALQRVKEKRSIVTAINWPVWVALVVAATPLLVFHSFIERAISLYHPYAWNKVSFSMTNIAYLDMVEAMLIPLGLLGLLSAVIWFLGGLCDQCRASILPGWLLRFVNNTTRREHDQFPSLRLYEVMPVLVLLLYPYLGWAVASLHGGMLSSRFVIPVCFGFASAGAYMVYRTFGRSRNSDLLFLSFFTLWFMAREAYIGYSYNQQKEALYSTFAALSSVDHAGEPIVVSDNLLVLPFHYYAPPDIASRVVYPIDISAIMRRRGEASGEVNLWTGRNTYGFSIVPLASFQKSASSYLLVTSEPDWLLDDLHANHYVDDPLPVDTHAEPLNFVATPLSHFKSEVFRVYGDQYKSDDPTEPSPKPFKMAGELPQTK